MTEKPTREDFKDIFVGSAAATIFIGIFVGGFLLKNSLMALGFKNDGDMGMPFIIYCILLVIFAIFIVPKYAIKWARDSP
jgi:hypothetical protein